MENESSNDLTKKKLLLIGGGGHCHSVIDSLLFANAYDEIGIVDNKLTSSCLGVPVIGTDNDLYSLFKNGWKYAAITVGSVGNVSIRKRLFQMAKEIGFMVPTIIDQSAIIAKRVIIEEGCFIGKRAILNAGAILHTCCIVNTGSIVEHDCEIGEFSHISPGSVLCGQVLVGNNTHIGAGSVVRQQIKIGPNALIGAGSVVVENIPENVKAYGNPCRVVKE